MVVRWLGAFGKGADLSASLSWELTQNREVAAEHITSGNGKIRHARVGLLVDKRAVIRVFPGDVWSVAGEDGKLRATRYASGYALTGRHSEAFCRPVYRAIMIKDHPDRIKPAIMTAVRGASETFSLPIVWIDSKGKKHSVK